MLHIPAICFNGMGLVLFFGRHPGGYHVALFSLWISHRCFSIQIHRLLGQPPLLLSILYKFEGEKRTHLSEKNAVFKNPFFLGVRPPMGAGAGGPTALAKRGVKIHVRMDQCSAP